MVVKALQEVRCEEGQEARFECAFEAKPKAEIKWFKDSREINANDSHFKVTINEDGTTSLVIAKTEKSDAGSIRCGATNIHGVAKTEAPLVVLDAKPKDAAPEFLKDLEPIDTTEGKGCVFECKVAGTPFPDIEWFKDGEKILPSNNIRIETLPDGTCRLIVDKTAMDHQGNYTCQAKNPLGVASSKAPLSVRPSQRLRLKRGLEDQDLTKGVKLQLDIEVEGKPKQVKWYKDNEELSASQRTNIEKVTDEVYRLVIEKSDLSDTGAYRVILSNDAESIESSCNVRVKDKVPEFKKGLSDQTLPQGNPLHLEIEVDGNPKDVKVCLSLSFNNNSRY